jgi:hypothetical protein
MNDCIFLWIGGCDGCEMGKCDQYLSANSGKGSSLLEEYQAEVEEALKPIKEKFRARIEKTN